MNVSTIIKAYTSQHCLRTLHTSSSCNLIQKWRKNRGLPQNPNTSGILTDKADYTFLDGRPTPVGMRQKERIVRQQSLVMKIMQLTNEVDFAVARHAQMVQDEETQRQNIIKNKLKPKGKLSLT